LSGTLGGFGVRDCCSRIDSVDEGLTMKPYLLATLVCGLAAVQAAAAEPTLLRTTMDKVNYGIGVETARKYKSQGIEINLDILIRGLKDGLADNKLLISEKELRKIIISFQNELRQKQSVSRKYAAMDNRKREEDFLAGNRGEPGIVTLPSGLQYRIIKAGSGRKPTDADAIDCTYRGTLLDGTEFDRSEEGRPATFRVANVIPGWREALKLMPVGSSWQLFIPSRLAYGERGAGHGIGPNETLIFELQLLAVH
jgi:FKBP-type peptidyl-prolyl cis-trans isomerase